MEGILPYRSSEFEVNPRNYQPWRDTEEIENMMIQKMVDQTLMSVLSTVSEEVCKFFTSILALTLLCTHLTAIVPIPHWWIDSGGLNKVFGYRLSHI